MVDTVGRGKSLPLKNDPLQKEEITQDHLQKVNKELYKRNFELAFKNKTLSLLRRLYDISTRTLEPENLCRLLTHEIRTALDFLMVSIFVIDVDRKNLYPIGLSVSDKVRVSFAKIEDKFSQLRVTLKSDGKKNLFTKTVLSGKANRNSTLSELFSPFFPEDDLENFRSSVGLRSCIIFPLLISRRPIGALVILLDKKIFELNNFTQEAVESLVDVIAVAVDRALIYGKLKLANRDLEELDQAKSEFMSIASHQLRTPLAGIMGYLSMIMDGDYGKTSTKQEPVLNDVLDATKRLIRMVNIFLNATRIEAGRFVMNYKKVPFADVVDAVYKELLPTADLKGVKLSYKKKKLPEVEVDVDKIKDVILNLIDNAIKYSPKGSVTVTTEVKRDKVKVLVKDTGVGIETKEAKNLFSKFVRGSGIAKVDPSGSGLGLFIAKKITEGHGGNIWAQSEGVGKGSTFQFEIPIKADPIALKKAEEFKAQATNKNSEVEEHVEEVKGKKE